jgi:hypothetical protein
MIFTTSAPARSSLKRLNELCLETLEYQTSSKKLLSFKLTTTDSGFGRRIRETKIPFWETMGQS